jgi:hypothetical protein
MAIHVFVGMAWTATLWCEWRETGDVSVQSVRIVSGYLTVVLKHQSASQALTGSKVGTIGDFEWRCEQ